MTTNIIYPGYRDPPKFGDAIPDTPEARQDALAKGATAFTTTAFEFEPVKGKREPKRFGSLYVDFDSKYGPEKAIAAARDFVHRLKDDFLVPMQMLRYWISGGKGCHIEIPAKLYGGENGHTHLPKILQGMTSFIQMHPADGKLGCIDLGLYCMGKGRLLRQENIQRKNSRHKVPVSCEEFFTMPIADLVELTKEPRHLTETQFPIPPEETPLVDLYRSNLNFFSGSQSVVKASRGLEAFEGCKFIQNCKINASILSEPEWHAMTTNMVVAGVPDHLIHDYSREYPNYSAAETDQKIRYARQRGLAHTCATIKEIFDCPESCNVNAPWQLMHNGKNSGSTHGTNEKFHLYPDGLYYISGDQHWLNLDAREKICSPLEVIAKIRNEDSAGWARRVKVTAPDGTINLLNVPMADLVQSADAVVGALVDKGLELAPQRDSKKRVIEYIQTAQPVLLQTSVSKIGWHGAVYVLPDKAYGDAKDHEYVFSMEISHFGVQGTLEDWQREIGSYLQGNKLPILAVSFAFSGILLTLCGMDGMGIHLHGLSSCGKTTTMCVAASICGGGSQGYIRAWRNTDNALEGIAVQHNDNLLCLDEISQADDRVVSEVAYMLPNGQGKGRARKSGEAKPIARWKVAFMSTGEHTLDNKIQLGGRQTIMAGQLVRVLDIPADAGHGWGVFSELHGMASSRELSDYLKEKAATFYGTPMREFLEQLTRDCPTHVQRVKESMGQFVQHTECEGMSPQITRVRERFALIAAAGELAIQFGVLPLAPGEALDAALHHFNQWVELRGGTGDSEVESALKRVQEFIDLHCENRFIDLDSDGSGYRTPYDLAGYKWRCNGEWYYLILPPVVASLCGNAGRILVIQELKKRGWVALNSAGKRMETKNVSGRGNVRGVVIVPSRWTDAPEDDASHNRTHAHTENAEEEVW